MSTLEDMDGMYAALSTRQRRYFDEAELATVQGDYEEPSVRVDEAGICTIELGLICPGGEHRGAQGWIECRRGAGQNTDHEGVGLCSEHGGHRGKGRIVGTWLMANAYAQELNVTPWEALLQQVRMLAGQVAFLQEKVNRCEREFGVDALKPGGEAGEWVDMLEKRGDRLARVAKMAIDAGVAERLVRQVELEAELMLKSTLFALDALGMNEDDKERALELMSAKMLELEAEQNGMR